MIKENFGKTGKFWPHILPTLFWEIVNCKQNSSQLVEQNFEHWDVKQIARNFEVRIFCQNYNSLRPCFLLQNRPAAGKMLFAILGVFLVCNISISIIAFGISYLGSNQAHLTAAGLLLLDVLILLYPAAMLANSCANFPLLLLTMGSFRKTLKKILKLQKWNTRCFGA